MYGKKGLRGRGDTWRNRVNDGRTDIMYMTEVAETEVICYKIIK